MYKKKKEHYDDDQVAEEEAAYQEMIESGEFQKCIEREKILNNEKRERRNKNDIAMAGI